MGSNGRRRRKERYVFPRSGPNPPTPPGGWPAEGSGYEPDPLSPAGTWLQASKIISALGRRRGRWFVIPIVILGLAVALLSLIPR